MKALELELLATWRARYMRVYGEIKAVCNLPSGYRKKPRQGDLTQIATWSKKVG